MSKMTNYLENLVLKRVIGGATWTAISTVYLGLFSSFDATDANDGTVFTEVSTSGTNYGRKTATFNAAAAGAAASSAQIDFGTASADWASGSNLTHWGLFDASTAGNMLYWGTMPANTTVLNGENLVINAGDLTVSLTNHVSATLANQILEATLRNGSSPTQATHIALLATQTGDTVTEVADASYARQAITLGTNFPALGSITGTTVANAAAISFPAAAANYTVNAVGFYSALTAGTMLFRGPITGAPKTIQTSKIFRFPTGNLSAQCQ